MSVPSNEDLNENESAQIYYLDGNFGIGTQEPKAKLHLSAGGPFGDLRIFSPKEPGADFAYDGGSDNVFYFYNYGADTGTTNFRHGNRDLFVIKNDGNVGIGTAGPNHKFHVVATDAVGLFESTGEQAYLRLSTKEGLDNRVEITNRPGGRLSLWTAGGGDALNITKAGNVGIGTTAPKAKLHVTADIVAGSDVNGQRFIFHSRTNGGGDFLHITGDDANGNWLWDRGLTFVRGTGNVGIGTANLTSRLHVAGNAGVLSLEGRDHAYIQWYPDGLNAGRKAWMGFGDVNSEQFVIANEFPNRGVVFTSNISTHGYDPYGGGHYPSNWGGGIHTWDVVCEATVGYSGLQQWSSIREKENIEYIDNVLDRIEALNPARFDRKLGYHNQSKGNLGFIAEEVREIFPELVNIDEKNNFFATAVRTDGMLALAIAGIKELSQQLKSLQTSLSINKDGCRTVPSRPSLEGHNRPVQILREETCLSQNNEEEQYVLVRFQGSPDGVNQVQCTRAYQIPNGMPKDLFLQERYNDYCREIQSKSTWTSQVFVDTSLSPV